MANRAKLDPKDPHYQDGKRMAVEMEFDSILADAKKEAEERKRASSGGDAPQTSKRDCVERGKPRGRRGGRRKATATATAESSLPSTSSEVSVPGPSAQTDPERQFELNMERLSAVLATCSSAEPQQSSANSWSLRQQKASERWKEARPFHLECFLENQDVGRPLCCSCQEPAVIRCRECLPEEWFCGDCDVLHHSKMPLHNRESIIDGFFKGIPPTLRVNRGVDGFCTHEQACILPTVKAPKCSCEGTNFTVTPGKPVILVTINGRYDLHHPIYTCRTCQQQWTPDFKDLLRSGYWPASISTSTFYSVDLLRSFQELKVIAPGFSRQAFAKLLDYRSKVGGRSGLVNGDALQRSFLEFTYSSFEEEELCCGAAFTCPACTPEMLAVSADGNRKLYRFKKNESSDDRAFFEGLFVAEDSDVSKFVETVHKAVKNTQGKGTCGDSQWRAARETSKKASNLDEEGMEVSVCRHGVLLKALNMYRGEIFAYPLYIQKVLMPLNATFFAMDVACKYWPYLGKAATALPALQELTKMKPFLSVMHARGHATKCEITWSGKNQEGAGTTAGEEVEQVNSYLSRCALTTKYMSKAARVDMLTLHAMGWNKNKKQSLHKALSARYVKTCQRLLVETGRLQELKMELHCTDDMVSEWISDVKEWAASEIADDSCATSAPQKGLQQSIEGHYLSLRQGKQTLYRENDSNKVRLRLRRKLAATKKLLLQEIQEYNSLDSTTANIDVAVMEHSLTGQSTVASIWPWEVHGSANISMKKSVHDQAMLTRRLQEEKGILVVEMAQHCTWLQNQAVVLKEKLAEQDGDQGNQGLCCLLKRRHSEVSESLQEALNLYKTALGPDASLLDARGEEESGLSSPDSSEDEED